MGATSSSDSRNPKTQFDIWALPLEGDRKPVVVTRSQFDEQQFSPDDRWIAVSSDASSRREVYVEPFAAASSAAGAVRVSTNGGSRPRWRRDGKELVYVGGDGKMISVEMNAGHAGLANTLFQTPAGFTDWDVSADRRRFLFAVPIADIARMPFTVVLNWQVGLKKPGSF
jgi:Tol biopolymer transport system component